MKFGKGTELINLSFNKNLFRLTILSLLLSSSAFSRLKWNEYDNSSICKKRNSSYDNAIEVVNEDDVVLTQRALPVECVQLSMTVFDQWTRSLSKSNKPFVTCSSENSTIKRIKKPLCRTEKLIKKVTKAYNITMDCFDIPSSGFFSIVSVESGFYPNILGNRGDDAGLGQVTGAAAADVDTTWKWVTNYINNSEKSSCRALAPHLKKLKIKTENLKNPCQLIAPGANPYRNLIYSGAFFLINKKYFLDYFKENDIKSRLESLVKRSITEDELKSTTDTLTYHSYNRGFSHAIKIYEDYISHSEKVEENRKALLANIMKSIQKINNSIAVEKKSRNFKLIRVFIFSKITCFNNVKLF